MQVINDLEKMGIEESCRVLVLMPHPDDEAVFISGLLFKLTQGKIPVRVVTMTKGEKSTLRYTLPLEMDLAVAREKELTKAFKILGVKDFEILDLPDGDLERQEKRLNQVIVKELKGFLPTHIVALEPDGIYGHPDHIALTKTVIQLVKQPLKLLLVTVSPHYVMPGARSMAKKKIISPMKPKYRLKLTFKEMRSKIRALKAHKSQFKIDIMHWKVIFFFLKNDMLRHEYYVYRQ